MAASIGEQTKEGTSGAPVVVVAQPGAAMTSQAEAAQPKPSSVRVAASLAGWMEEDVPEASLADVAIG